MQFNISKTGGRERGRTRGKGKGRGEEGYRKETYIKLNEHTHTVLGLGKWLNS